eukprot:7037057-Prymnesium_polylepis.1
MERLDSKSGSGRSGSHAVTGASSTWWRQPTRLAADCRPSEEDQRTCAGKWRKRRERLTCGTTTTRGQRE